MRPRNGQEVHRSLEGSDRLDRVGSEPSKLAIERGDVLGVLDEAAHNLATRAENVGDSLSTRLPTPWTVEAIDFARRMDLAERVHHTGSQLREQHLVATS